LFDAAESVISRDGVSGLTSRAVTAQAGVAKGVMHHHFPDFDAFLAELICDRAAKLDAVASALRDAAGAGTVVGNLTDALKVVFSPLAVAVVALVVTRDGLRDHLRSKGASRFPLIAEGTVMVARYLAGEQALGRIVESAEVEMLSHTIVGSAHLLFSDREGGRPDDESVQRVVSGAMGAALL